MSKYITFNETGASPSGKTKTWDVVSVRTGDILGTIQWFGRWRQYAFDPTAGTTWNSDCLGSVADFLRAQMDLRR